jgi:hypothetical protein
LGPEENIEAKMPWLFSFFSFLGGGMAAVLLGWSAMAGGGVVRGYARKEKV